MTDTLVVTLRAGALSAVLAFSVASPARALASQAYEIGPVVFVCEHGNVKSLIAKEWFDRLAAERGMAVRGISRGLTPELAVAANITEKLRLDGFDVRDFRPRGLVPEDLRGASRLVLIGADPPGWVLTQKVTVERWDAIPPASQQYEASRDAMKERITLLLDSLAGSRSTR